jgi:lysophospholipase L1-like esterase
LYPESHLSFLNRGVSGNRVGDLAQRWQVDTLDLKPDVLSILVGINDVFIAFMENKTVSVEEYERTYDKLLADAVAAKPGIKLILGEPFLLKGKRNESRLGEWQATVARMRTAVARLGEKYHAPVVRFQAVFDAALKRAPIEYWIWDGIHPTYAGHQLMAEEWARVYRAFYGAPAAR